MFLDVGRPLKHRRTDPTIFATIGGKLVPLPVKREQNLKSPMIKDVPRPSKLTNRRANLSRAARLWTRKRQKETRVLGNDVPKIVAPLLLFNSDSDSWGSGDGQAQTDGGAGPVVESSHKTGPMSGKTFQASEASGFSFPTHISVSGGEHTKPSASQGLQPAVLALTDPVGPSSSPLKAYMHGRV